MKTGSVVIFGMGNFATLAWYCLEHDSALRVEAFTVDRAFIRAVRTHHGVPVVPFDELEANYPPAQIDLFIPLGFQLINELRKARYLQAKARGYRFASYVSSQATVWADVRVGENCMIQEHAVIEPGVSLGNNVFVRNGARVGRDCRINDHVFLSPQAVLGSEIDAGEQAFVGAGAVVRDRVRLGRRSYVGTGAHVLSDTDADGVYIGDPARKTDKIDSLEVTGG